MSLAMTITGNLVRDFEIIVFESGKQIARSAVAYNERKRDADGNWVDGDTTFFEIVVFDRGAMIANVTESLAKGTRVVVTGNLRIREYDRKDGEGKGKAVELLVEEIAPSLRFATVEVTKNEKRSGNGGSPLDEADF